MFFALIFVVSARVLPNFVSLAEREHLLARVDGGPWELGRLGTGYEKRVLADDPVVDAITERALAAMGASESRDWDRYLLRYDAQDRAPEHLDEAPDASSEHHRLNALIQAGQGGRFVLEGEVIELQVGDAVVFRPDLQPHAVEPMQGGVRLVFSVGVTLTR